MQFDPQRAEIRFGCGLSPSIAPHNSVDDILAALTGPDKAAKRFPIPGYDASIAAYDMVREARRGYRKAKSKADKEAAREKIRDARRAGNSEAMGWLGMSVSRRALTQDGFRERLAAFWSDHFTATSRIAAVRYAHATYAEEAIRPHVAGRFSDLLRSAVTHPFMLWYLDQHLSVGPASKSAEKSNRLSGLNENLAREIMELHTLGVDGPYNQTDVREFAELLTGLTFDNKEGTFKFRPVMAEPGPETVLGKLYGGRAGQVEDIYEALDDLARHPVTARHISRKLAVHFVSDTPDESLVMAMADRFSQTNGHLPSVYDAMLRHPAAWRGTGNVKQPMDFIGSSLRALDIRPKHVPIGQDRKMRQMFHYPLKLMGQEWGAAKGPDGFEEEDSSWITPQRLAARLQWSMTVPFKMRRVLPDPREFVDAALGATVPEPVRFAARAAETKVEGVGIVLASPAFQRM